MTSCVPCPHGPVEAHGRTTSGGIPSSSLDSTHDRTTCEHDIPSSSLGSTHGRTTSGVACHHHLWTMHMVRRRQAWHVILAVGLHKHSDNIVRGTPSRPWAAHMVGCYRAWHARIVLGRHTRSDDVERSKLSSSLSSTRKIGLRRTWHAIIGLGQHTRQHIWSDDVGREIPSSPLGNTHGQTTLSKAYNHRPWKVYTIGRHRVCSGVSCYHCPWTTHTIESRRVLNASMALGQNMWSDDFGHGMQYSQSRIIHGKMKSTLKCHHRSWTANMVERCWACHAIISLGQHTRSDDIERNIPWEAYTVNDTCCGMPLSPLGSAHIRMTLGMKCDHRPWAAHRVGLRHAWHAIITIGQHTQLDDVAHDMQESRRDNIHELTVGQRCAWNSSITVGLHTRSDYVGCSMLPSPLVSIDDGTTSSMTLPHGPWATHTGSGRRHTRSNDVERDMSSSPLGITHGRTTSGVTCHMTLGQQTPSDDVRRVILSSPYDNTYGRTMSGMACHQRTWTARMVSWTPSSIAFPQCSSATHMVGLHWAWYAIISIGKHTRLDYVECGIPSSPLDSTRSDYVGHGLPPLPFSNAHDRTKSGIPCHHRPCEAYTPGRH
ncbi:hypothetical protein EJD97_011281 [Solanum chilense]|uniref:Uncharacterized protein n=1 Tax=Solanum chilense TaxID=4083 RepID=A0A6N2BLZ3_SOLCI|nr:hypothetical protein EJD97_011281 [Solanum chilense]